MSGRRSIVDLAGCVASGDSPGRYSNEVVTLRAVTPDEQRDRRLRDQRTRGPER
jgi:hypothetical protein